MTIIKEKIKQFAQLDNRKQAAEQEALIGELISMGVEPLIATAAQAQEDKDKLVRSGIAFLLGKINDTRAIEPLCLMLKDRFPSVRAMAGVSLCNLRNARVVEPLINVLRNEQDSKVLREVAASLAMIGDARAVAPLEQLRDVWSTSGKNPPYMSVHFQRCIDKIQGY